MAESVINRIAAGEIIVAPANALKEMLENCIDAKATQIQVAVKDGGLKLLQITDNGSGIMKDDLPILCQRFTTSKLAAFEDLQSISTYGFRGEALASISHISHFRVITKTKDSSCAWKCQYSQGKLVPTKPGDSPDAKPVAGKNGTQITVENLFYNFPSRLKSLRSTNEEYLKILDVVQKYAIHTPGVGFVVKKVGESHSAINIRDSLNIKEKIRLIYGSDVSNNLICIESSEEVHGLRSFSGQISNLNYYNNKKSHILFFINNRLVNCDPLKRAILNIYSIFLPKGTKPFIYLNLQINPKQMDVNIHPTKKEVRFLNEEEIISTISNRIQDELSKIDDTRTFRTEMILPKMDFSKNTVEQPLTKKQKLNISSTAKLGNLSQFAFSSKPRSHESKLVRVDASQKDITTFLKPLQASQNPYGDSPSQPHTPDFASQVLSERTDLEVATQKGESTTTDQIITSETDPKIFKNKVLAVPGEIKKLPVESADGIGLACESIFDKDGYTFVANKRVNVSLDTILELREDVEKHVNKPLTDLFSNFVFVGIVQYSTRLLTLQHEINLYLVDYGKLFYNMFYQIGLSEFSNFGKIYLKDQIFVKDCMELILLELPEVNNNVSEEINQNGFIHTSIKKLVMMKEMLEEYFNIVIDSSDDSSNPKIVAIPMYLKNHIPSLNKLPILIFKLATKIDFTDEKTCLDGILKELALFYVPDVVPEYDEVMNEDEPLEMTEYIKQVVFLLTIVKKRLLATDDMLNSIVEIANLPALYKCFERC